MDYRDPFGSYMANPYYSQQYYQPLVQQPMPQQPAAPSPGSQLASAMVNSAVKKGVQSGVNAIGGMSTPATSGVVEGGVGTAIDGSTMMANPAFASGAQAPGVFSMSGIGSAGNAMLPIAGTIGAYDLFSKKKHGKKGAVQGAASGAAIGSYLGPWGALAGALIGGGLGYVGNFGDVDRWKEEQDAVGNLARTGVTGWDQYARAQPQLSKGRSKSELINKNYASDFRGATKDGWVNNKFAESRNEKDLTGKDIWGYSSFGDTFGNDWFGKFNEGQREQIANKALELGATEGKGQIQLQNTDELKKYATELTKAFTKKK